MKISLKILIPIVVLVIGFLFGQYFLEIAQRPKIETLPKGVKVETSETIKPKVSLLLDFGNGNIKKFENIKLGEGKTVFDLLKRVTQENNMELSYKEYPGLGAFVESIDNLANDPKNNKWWQYWVDGEYGQAGASLYKLKNGDIVEWKYIGSQF